MFSGCLAEYMPTGLYLRRKLEDGYIKKYPTSSSFKATEWLANIEHTQKINIQHARNGAEHRVGTRNIPVDGYCMLVFFAIIHFMFNYVCMLVYMHYIHVKTKLNAFFF